VNPVIEKDLFRRARAWLFVRRTLVFGVLTWLLLWELDEYATGREGVWGLLDLTGRIMGLLPVLSLGLCLHALQRAQALMQREWARNTIIDLGATPLFPRGLAFGKAAAGAWEALAEVVGVLPFAVILLAFQALALEAAYYAILAVEGAALFGLLGVLAASRRPSGRFVDPGQLVSVVVCAAFAALFILTVAPPLRTAILGVPAWVAAAVPPVFVLHLRAETVGRTALPMPDPLLAAAGLVEPLALIGLLVWLVPRRLERSFGRMVGTERGKKRRHWRSERPAIGPNENPFAWQERGGATKSVRRLVWFVYGLVALIVAALTAVPEVGNRTGWFSVPSNVDEVLTPNVLLILGIAGIGVNTLAAAAAAGEMFTREKVRQTAEALVLTGHTPGALMRGKVQALVRALRWPTVGALVPLGAYRLLDPEASAGLVVGLAAAAVAAPLGFALIALALSPRVNATGEGLAAAVLVLLLGGGVAALDIAFAADGRPLVSLTPLLVFLLVVAVAWAFGHDILWPMGAVTMFAAAGVGMALAQALAGAFLPEKEAWIAGSICGMAALLSGLVWWWRRNLRDFETAMLTPVPERKRRKGT
jgi:hypothetical protein